MKSYFKVRFTLPNYCRLRFFFSLTECVTHCQSFYADFYADFELQKSTQSDILSFKLRDPLAFIKTSTTDMGSLKCFLASSCLECLTRLILLRRSFCSPGSCSHMRGSFLCIPLGVLSSLVSFYQPISTLLRLSSELLEFSQLSL